MEFTEILSRFADVTEQRDGYLAKCSAHDDTDPSLKIFLGVDRKARFVCRAGCATEDVVRSAGLTWGDLFDVTGEALTVPKEKPLPASEAHIAALAQYIDTTSEDLSFGASQHAVDARDYMADRFGISEFTLAKLGLGLGVDYEGSDAVLRWRSPSFKAFPRLTVPLYDFSGVARGLQGRDLSGECPGRWVSLMNPRGHRWAAYGVLRSGGDTGVTIVTEGPGDGLTACAAGYDAVIIRGAALASSPELVGGLADGLRGQLVIVAGDGDAAGQRFNHAIAAGLAPFGIETRALSIAEGSDITAWRESDPEGFEVAFHQAVREAAPVPAATREGPDAESADSAAERVPSKLADVRTMDQGVAAKAFGRAYWDQQREVLDVKPDVRDVEFARFVADQCGDTIRYVKHVGWFRWNGRVWAETGDTGAAMNAVTDASRILMRHAADSPVDTGWAAPAASKMLVNSVRKAIVAEMQVLREFMTDIDALDANRHLLTFQNGTVDLRTGELRGHAPADLMTQCAPVNYVPGAACPRWLKFVDEVFPGDEELQRYYQTFLGMCITGEVRDHALAVWYGEHGRNGKGCTVRTMTAAFGKDLIHEVPYELFENVRGQQVHTETIAALRSARMVIAQEGNQGAPMNTARLKNWSGGDRIEARHLYGKAFNFEPKFTIVLATNYLPELSSGGQAVWDRTKAILFGQSFANRVDIDLEPTIQGPEREGVAAWVVAGAVAYYAAGRLVDPLSVVAATEHHKDEVDPLKPLVGELFDYEPTASVKRSAFNAELREWRSDNGENGAKYSPSTVKRHLLSNGVREVRKPQAGWTYEGIFLLSDPPRKAPAGPGIFAQQGEG